jgi:hypothetical protein
MFSKVVILFLILGTGATTSFGQYRFRSPFRYVVVHNLAEPDRGKGDEPRRFVEVLMDGKEFNKANLTTLFKLISKRYPRPMLLFINVFTSLADVQTPEERDEPKGHASGIGQVPSPNPDVPIPSDTAVYVRTRTGESFNIRYANGDFDEVKIR